MCKGTAVVMHLQKSYHKMLFKATNSLNYSLPRGSIPPKPISSTHYVLNEVENEGGGDLSAPNLAYMWWTIKDAFQYTKRAHNQ